MKNKLGREVLKIARDCGLESPKLQDVPRGHPKLTGFYRGREVKVVIASSPSEPQWRRLKARDIRRACAAIDAALDWAPELQP